MYNRMYTTFLLFTSGLRLLVRRVKRLLCKESNIGVRVLLELLQRWCDLSLDHLLAFWCVVQHAREHLERLCDVETDVGDRVADHGQHGLKNVASDGWCVERRSHGGDGKDCGHTVEVVGVGAHLKHLGDDGLSRPLHAKHVGELFEVDSSSLSNAEDCVTKPRHAEVAELLIEELNAKLVGKKGDVFDDGLSNTPLLVLSKLDDRGQKRLREKVDADDLVDLLQLGDDVETNVGELVLEKLQEQGQEVLNRGLLAEQGSKTRDLHAEGSTDVLRVVTSKVAHAGHQSCQDDVLVDELGEARDLTCTSRSYLSLIVLEEVDESHDELVTYDVLTNSGCKLDKVICDHVSYPPALVLNSTANRWKKVVLGLVVTERFCDGDEVLHGQQANRVLVIGGEFSVERNDVRDHELLGEVLCERTEIACGGSSDHGGIVVA